VLQRFIVAILISFKLVIISIMISMIVYISLLIIVWLSRSLIM